MIAISNSSPLIILSCIDRLDILAALFENVYIPDAVYGEVVRNNHLIEQKSRIVKAVNEFIQVASPTTHQAFTRRLGAGEEGVLTLSLEMAPDVVLLDDKKARNEAKALNLPIVFSMDILKWAEHRGLISS